MTTTGDSLDINFAANQALITNGSGVPTSSATLPSAVQGNITALGAQSQTLNMNTHTIIGVVDPTNLQDVATKNYVDNIALGGGQPVVAATTANLNATYNNGVSGVGATLTDASGTFAAFTVDGQSPSVGARILVKDQTTAANRGVYTLTTNGDTISIPWVLTRATDYDTPNDINTTGLIPVENGTVNANSAWYNTTKMVAVGTTALTFVKFGVASGINKVVTQVITSSATYTPTAGMVYALTQLWGDGGGGGGVTGGTAGNASAGSGGGAGGYSQKTYTAALIGANATVVIGTGGAGGTSGNNSGSTGGGSTFTPAGAGATLTCNGGTGGAAMAKTASGTEGSVSTGGTATGGDVNIQGGNGSPGEVAAAAAFALQGNGGIAPLFGSNLQLRLITSSNGGNGANAHNYGNGGSGGVDVAASDRSGGNGAPGICVITEYCSV